MHVDFRHAWGILLGVLFTIVLEAAGVPAAQDAKVLHVGNFSRGEPGGRLPEGWKPLTFKKIESHTDYRLVEDQGHTVVKAYSNSSSSALTREIKVDPKEYPIVQWSWKVEHLPQQGDVTKKSGDDYAARLYVTFEYDPSLVGLLDKAKYVALRMIYGRYPPFGAINYIWERKTPRGTIVPNPYTSQVKMIVLETGTVRLNEWVEEERNIYEDFKQAFEGREPPMISGVAIMTDTDNTGEQATAYYGDIFFHKAP